MKYFILFLLTASLSAQATSQYKGFVKTENILTERIMAVGEPIMLPRYLPGTPSGFGSIYELLGTYESVIGTRTYKNGHPNSLNILIWYVLLSSLAKDLGENCIRPTTLKFNPVFAQNLQSICNWPQASAKDETVMENFWIALMGYDAPQEEYFAWRDFFKTSSYQNRTAEETVSAMSEAIFLNPFFLLER